GSGLTAAPWNGATGGILVIDVAGNLNLGGATVSVDGMGFRGGGTRQLNGGSGGTNTDFRNVATSNFHGGKGEGVVGTPRYVYDSVFNTVTDTGVEGYPNGSTARGAPGNAGGGGTDGNPTTNDQNSGGGGGANGGAGGLGGNTWSSNLARGGYGGASITGAADLVVLGGGGGGGSRNNSTGTASSGGAGGGIVMIRSASVSGSGTISANGANGNGADNDGGGGAGAGGSVLFVASSGGLGGLTINARGGRGGNAWPNQAPNGSPGDRHGPGGGGGGGSIAVSASASTDVSGGANGVTTTASDPYGATSGSSGSVITVATSQIPGAGAGAQRVPLLTSTKTTSTPSVTNSPTGTTATYSITIANSANRSSASNLTISDTLPAGFTYNTTVTVTLNGGATRPTTTNPTTGDAVPNWGTFTIPGGGSVVLNFTSKIAFTVSSGSYQNPATATYTDPARTTSGGTTTSSYNPASSTAEDVTVIGGPNVILVKSVSPSGPQAPGVDLAYTIAFTNNGGVAAQALAIIDPIPSTTDFKVGSVTSNPGTTGLTVSITYSNDGGSTWTYTPVSGGGGASAGYDRSVTNVRWTFTGNLSQVSPNNGGSVSFTARIR
ncbi:MAG: isopeptide-forming domain-containing fimbrial protein, partial [Acidobacteriota bacterium]